MQSSEIFFASCPVGPEELLAEEIKEIIASRGGKINVEVSRGGVRFNCPFTDALIIMLRTRLASKIYWELASFEVRNEKDIYDNLMEHDWTDFFSIDKTFKIQTVFGGTGENRARFNNSLILSQIAKDAIADVFRKVKNGERPNVDTKMPDIPFLLYVERGQANFYLDLSGEPLGNRHYRHLDFAAPLRENLAAAILKWTGHDFESRKPFIDGMCGSGTFLMEALLMPGNIPPSYLKIQKKLATPEGDTRVSFALEKCRLFMRNGDWKKFWKAELTRCHQETLAGFEKLESMPLSIYGSDISSEAVNVTAANLKKAGLAAYCLLDRRDALTLKREDFPEHLEENGTLVFNPPYGERLEADKEPELKELYKKLGDQVKQNFKGYKVYLLTGNKDLRKAFPLQTSKRIKVYNGDIECRLLEYKLF
jgi:23S rRNA G2445 N2-methylase RlmL